MPSLRCPRRGEIVWLDFEPHVGHEQGGHRPALVLTTESYNRKVGLALCCPITGQVKGYPFEVIIPEGLKVSGAVLSDQVKSVDWRSRQSQFCCHANEKMVDEVLGKITALLEG